MYIYVYIYIYIERERDIHTYIYIYICIMFRYICITQALRPRLFYARFAESRIATTCFNDSPRSKNARVRQVVSDKRFHLLVLYYTILYYTIL